MSGRGNHERTQSSLSALPSFSARRIHAIWYGLLGPHRAMLSSSDGVLLQQCCTSVEGNLQLSSFSAILMWCFAAFFRETCCVQVLMAAGVTCSFIAAASTPYFLALAAQTVDSFFGSECPEGVRHAVDRSCLRFTIAGLISMVSSFLFILCWTVTGQRQCLRIKGAYVEAVLHQNTAWYDAHPPGQLLTLVPMLMSRLQDGM